MKIGNQNRLKQEIGNRYGNLFVVERVPKTSRSTHARWRCVCACGGETVTAGTNLRNGHTTDCGCNQLAKSTKHGHSRQSGCTPEYNAYCAAKKRCQNPNERKYPDYGGRGILFLFNSFDQFYKELGPRPSPLHSVDRKNNDGNYEPGNIRWATKKEQSANSRKRQRIEKFTNEELLAECQRRGLIDQNPVTCGIIVIDHPEEDAMSQQDATISDGHEG